MMDLQESGLVTQYQHHQQNENLECTMMHSMETGCCRHGVLVLSAQHLVSCGSTMQASLSRPSNLKTGPSDEQMVDSWKAMNTPLKD